MKDDLSELIAEIEAAEEPLTEREAWRLALIATGGQHEALTYHVCGALMGSLDAAIRCLPENLGYILVKSRVRPDAPLYAACVHPSGYFSEGRWPAAALVAVALRIMAHETK